MAKVPVGKVLLRNVIRHTDAHNKIQEESEMWKQRGIELQTSSGRDTSHSWTTRRTMHCDRYLEDSEGSARGRLGERGCLSERDEREARYWTRKLHEFEANDPDRWGHSGFKELYPEEFQSDSEAGGTKHRKNGKEKKKSKKSSKNKKRKKKKKQRTEGSGSESDSSVAAADVKRKPKRKSGKSKHRRKKERRHKVTKDSSPDDSDSDRGGEKGHRKRHRTRADTQTEPERKKRKNWKAANEEKSESSED